MKYQHFPWPNPVPCILSNAINHHNVLLRRSSFLIQCNLVSTPLDPCAGPTGTVQRFLSAGLCRQTAVSPLNADMLKDAKFRQAGRGPFELPLRGAEVSVPCSMSSSSSSDGRGIGMAAEGDSLTVSAARACTSSDRFSPSWRRSLEVPCAIDLTTSPLQMGHVLRLLTSQGVLGLVSGGKAAILQR